MTVNAWAFSNVNAASATVRMIRERVNSMMVERGREEPAKMYAYGKCELCLSLWGRPKTMSNAFFVFWEIPTSRFKIQ
jgi:hypothetical protein